MTAPLQLQCYQWGNHQLELYVPQPDYIQQTYRQSKATAAGTPFPYWAQVWPAAWAMGAFLWQHPHYIQNKTVLELAAGLGLPSLIAARFASHVCCSDYLPEAVSVMQASVDYNQLQNVQCRSLNWHFLPHDLAADVLLLSDINYEPDEFETLYQVLMNFLNKGTTILLSTPQRLMAKPFIDRLMPYCIYQQEVAVPHLQQTVMTTILVLHNSSEK
jgi:methyltransferase-like protein 23